MKKLAAYIFALIFLMVFVVSCDNYIKDSDLVDVSLNVSSEKWLSAKIDTTITEYRYTAIPLFEIEDPGKIFGKVSEEKSIGFNSWTTLGHFTAGKWRFHVYGYNKSGSLVREGETEVYLKRTLDGIQNTVYVTLEQSRSRLGNVHFAFETNNVSTKGSYVMLRYCDNTGAYTTTTKYLPSKTENNLTYYDFTISNLTAGSYIFEAMLYDGDVLLGGSAVSTYILDNATTEITGTIYPSEHIWATFHVEIPEGITGTLSGAVVGAVNAGHEFEYKVETGSPVKFVWRVDGAIKQEGASNKFTFTPTARGAYTITCTALSSTGLEAGTSNIVLNVKTGTAK